MLQLPRLNEISPFCVTFTWAGKTAVLHMSVHDEDSNSKSRNLLNCLLRRVNLRRQFALASSTSRGWCCSPEACRGAGPFAAGESNPRATRKRPKDFLRAVSRQPSRQHKRALVALNRLLLSLVGPCSAAALRQRCHSTRAPGAAWPAAHGECRPAQAAERRRGRVQRRQKGLGARCRHPAQPSGAPHIATGSSCRRCF